MTAVDSTPRQASLDRREAMELAETAYQRFADVVEQLGAPDWALPTDCEGWTVRDLVGHMVGAMRSAASFREMLSQRREIKKRLKAEGGNETEWMTAVQVERTSALSTMELSQECRRLVGKATAGRRRTPALLRRLVSFPVEMGSINERWRLGYLIDVILTRDAWMHRIDLCRAIGAEPVLDRAHDGRLIEDIVEEWAHRHGQPYRLILTGAVGGSFEWGNDVATLELDAVDFCRALSGRAPAEGLLATEVPF